MADGKFKPFSFYIPESDTQLLQFLAYQSNMSLSMRLLMKAFIAGNRGLVDDISTMDLADLIRAVRVDPSVLEGKAYRGRGNQVLQEAREAAFVERHGQSVNTEPSQMADNALPVQGEPARQAARQDPVLSAQAGTMARMPGAASSGEMVHEVIERSRLASVGSEGVPGSVQADKGTAAEPAKDTATAPANDIAAEPARETVPTADAAAQQSQAPEPEPVQQSVNQQHAPEPDQPSEEQAATADGDDLDPMAMMGDM